MNTFNIRIILSVSIFLFSCNDEEVAIGDVININAKVKEINADGTATTLITCSIPIKAKADKRTIIVKTTYGTFEDITSDQRVKKVSIIADKEEENRLVATTEYTSSLDAGDAIIYATIEGFTDSTIVKQKLVTATAITLATDDLGVAVNFIEEINLTGTLVSESSGKVSKGNKVKFVDTFIDGSPVGGTFRKIQSSSDNNSQVTATYSPGEVTPGQYIYLSAIILNEQGNETAIKDQVKIYLKPQ